MSMTNNKEKSINELNEMDKIYIRTHALRIQDPNISESQKANCKWRIAEVCDFQKKIFRLQSRKYCLNSRTRDRCYVYSR